VGGGLMVFNRRASVTLEFTQFIENDATIGGALAQERSGSSSLTSCGFFGNKVTSNGGAVHSSDSAPLFFSFCEFRNCTCSGSLSRGGTMSLDSGRVTVANTTIQGGVAGYGGGVYTTDTIMSLEDSVVSECRALRQGGAIEVTSFSELDIRHSEILASDALQSGGGIFASATCTVTAFDSKFENLTSLANGGVVYLEYMSMFTSESCTFRFNSAGNIVLICLFAHRMTVSSMP
jgi:hypothetical protein